MTNSGTPAPGIPSAASVGGTLPGVVVAGHGDFAAGMRDAVERVAGAQERLATVSNHGLDAERIVAVLVEAVDRVRADVIFTDLPAGSCTLAARRLAKTRGNISVVTGANLPMLLDFLLTGRTGSAGAAVAAAKGREAITVESAALAPMTDTDVARGG